MNELTLSRFSIEIDRIHLGDEIDSFERKKEKKSLSQFLIFLMSWWNKFFDDLDFSPNSICFD